MLTTFKELTVWQEAMKLVELVYLYTKNFPKEEIYGLTSQMRRSAISIPANIAEGYRRKGKNEYLYFLSIASGSIAELETYILIAQRLNFLTKDNLDILQAQVDLTGRLLSALRKSLAVKSRPPTPDTRPLSSDPRTTNPKPRTLNPIYGEKQ